MLRYFDICVNIDSPQFQGDAAEVISDAQAIGVHHIALTGSSIESTKVAIRMAHQHKGCIATCGIHPHDAKNYSNEAKNTLYELSEDTKVRAIGECGLDYNRMYSTKEDQIICFEGQLELAKRRSLPVFLHERDAHLDFLDIIRRHHGKGVVHCFTGGPSQAKAYLDCGLFIGVTGWVCDERRNQDLLEALKVIPLERLMIETDAPWLTPRTYRPRPKKNRNTPALLPHIAEFLSIRMRTPLEELVHQTTQNALSFFGQSLE